MQGFDFSYDKENDDLFLFNPGTRSRGSIELGGIILDYNSRGEVVGIELMNACQLISDMTGQDADSVRAVLSELKGCGIEAKSSGNLLILRIVLQGANKRINPVISVPRIRNPSPALAFA